MSAYSSSEMMISRAAKELEDGERVLVGVGVPNLACNLAKRLHAPDLELVYESGAIGSDPASLPLSIGDPVLVSGARSVVSMVDSFGYYLQGGRIDVGFLGCAQIDRFGNLNSTVIGRYDEPTVRLPGSGGACEIASNSHRTIVITTHSRRRFVDTLDFVTSPGYLEGRKQREDVGLPGGPSAVITDKAVCRYDETGEMYLAEVHPGSSVDDVQSATGWSLNIGASVTETPPPTSEELRVIREDLDPTGIYVED